MNNLFNEFITPEEEKEWEKLTKEAINKGGTDTAIVDKLTKISNSVYRRYLKSRNNDINAILQDMYDVIDGVTIEAYEEHLEDEKYKYDFLTKNFFTDGLTQDEKKELQQLFETIKFYTCENLKSFMFYVDGRLLQGYYKALTIWSLENRGTPQIIKSDNEDDKDGSNFLLLDQDDKLGERIYNKYIELYPNAKDKLKSSPPKDLQVRALDIEDIEKNYLSAFHGNATDALALMVKDKINDMGAGDGIGKAKEKDVLLEIEKYEELKGTLGASTHKLLFTAISDFTEHNSKAYIGQKEANIPLKEYALECGIEIEAKQMTNPEAQKKENLRAENALKNFRRKVKKDLDVIFNSSITWKEKIKGDDDSGDYNKVRLIESQGIQNGYIKMTFTDPFSKYLVKLPITQYPKALLKIPERNPNAYSIGYKMATHYHMDNNQIHGNANILKINTLLKVTSLPTIAKVREERRDWEERIKEPFEHSLDLLTQVEALEDWRYSKKNGEEIPDEEATFNTFEEWADTNIYFVLKDTPDQTKRIEKNREAKEAKKAKNNKRKKKTTTA